MLGKSGDYKANVLKVSIPRNDLSVGMDVMMGDPVLTQDEVNPVMSALLDNGLDVTALYGHFLWDEPRMFYMHVHGRGTPADLAGKVKPARDLIGQASAYSSATGGARQRDRHAKDHADCRPAGRADRPRR